jgi:hypothetical protein
MYKRFLVSILSLLLLSVAHAQTTYKIYGKITSNKLEPLAFVSVQLKQSQSGTITKEDGTYSLTVEEGTYDLMISMIGYKPQTIKLTVTQDYQQNIIMEEDDTKPMEDIVIRVKVRDRSEEIIKNVIQNKDAIENAAGPYSARLYIKAIQQDSTISRKERARTDSAFFQNPNADIANMTMAEILLHLDYESDQRIKEERLGVKVNGNPSDLYYLSATDGDFNFYNNLIRVPTISNIPFLSPISYSGLLAYKFKMQKIEKKDGLRNYTISVKPRQISNATVEGEITIQDSTWAILHTKFKFPSYHLPEYDFFEVEQQYNYVQNKQWSSSITMFKTKRGCSRSNFLPITPNRTSGSFPGRHSSPTATMN